MLKVLQFWRDLELFSPPDVSISSGRGEDPVSRIEKDSSLPWRLRAFADAEDKTWVHTLYVGILKKEDLISQLSKALQVPLSQREIESAGGYTCLFCVALDSSGRPFPDTYTVMGSGWGLGQVSQGKGIDGFDTWLTDNRKSFCMKWQRDDAIKDRTKDSPEETEEVAFSFSDADPWTVATIVAELDRVLAECGLKGVYPASKSFEILAVCKSRQISRRFAGSVSGDALLQSFFYQDLVNIAGLASTGKPFGKGLSAYLSPKEPPARIDVRRDTGAMDACLDLKLLPSGRWPTKTQHSLVLAQQAAVNQMFEQLAQGGILGVNGPPGTGKTTLLRDVIASVITQRATRIAGLASPDKLFSGETKRFSAQTVCHYFAPNVTSIDDAIVVTSNNNAAVENVSLEIPRRGAVEPEFFETSDYFRSIADGVLGEASWGLLSAKLGNAANRGQFVSRIWFVKNKPGEAIKYDLRTWLRDKGRDESAWIDRWRHAKSDFQAALASWERKKRQLTEAQEGLASLYSNRALITSPEAKEKLEELRGADPKNVNEFHRMCSEELKIYQKLKTTLAGQAPNLLHQIFRTKKYVAWKSESTAVEGAIAVLTKVDRLARSGTVVPMDDFWRLPECERQLSSPWSGEEQNRLRTKVFLKALDLHYATIMANSSLFIDNLRLAMDLVQGRLADGAEAKDINNLWASFFFCIPVVSTTLASFPRLFSGVEQDTLGWVLVDESGQATPQSVVGAIWRAHRTIVVGDPLQTEPVVPLPAGFIKLLMKRHKVEDLWSPAQTSAQQLADRATVKGAWLGRGAQAVWSGLPLRVHRRCNNPMFDISNRIAYDEQMVKGVPDRDFDSGLGASAWYDVKGTVSYGHAIQEEIVLLSKLIETARTTAADAVYVIAPFRSVANAAWKAFSRLDRVSVGTIHTFQGKEADIVFLLLGGDPSKPGAIRWASSRPNLLNVAVTRAKRRLYVVGNRTVWGAQPFFSEMVTLLEMR